MMAAEYGHLEIVRLLLENGADLNAVSKQGRTALGLAETYRQPEIVRYLTSHGSLQAKDSSENGIQLYPSTPEEVVQAFAEAALAATPITCDEMRSCSDKLQIQDHEILRVQYAYLPNHEDLDANRKNRAINLGQPWGPYWGKWDIVTGFEIKEVKKSDRSATVKVVYRRVGWMKRCTSRALAHHR